MQSNTPVDENAFEPERRFRIRHRYIAFGNPLLPATGLRTGATDRTTQHLLFENEVAVDVGNVCWLQNGEARRILDHHFEGQDTFPSAAAAVLSNIQALASWGDAMVAAPRTSQDLWVTTHDSPDFDAFCASNLARWILLGELTPAHLEPMSFVHHLPAGLPKAVNWFSPRLPSGMSAEGRSAVLLASYASCVDQGRLMHTPRSRRLHALLYAAISRGRPLLEDAAASFFDEAWRRLKTHGLNPLFDSVFDPSEPSCPYGAELALLQEDQAAYQRDINRARRVFVQVYRSDEPFDRWFEKLAHVPFFSQPGIVDPRHLKFPGHKLSVEEGIFLRDPQSLLFKEWAREDVENSAFRQGFLFTAIAYSHGRAHRAGGRQSQYVFSLDPERARGRHLYNLWARLQEAEFRQMGIAWSPSEPGRRDFAGRKVGPDPWFDGNSYRGTIIDTPWRGTDLRAGSTDDLSDSASGSIESIVRQELEFGWYSTGKIEIWDFATTPESDVELPSKGAFLIGHRETLPPIHREHLRVASVELRDETETFREDLATQIGRDLWQVLEDVDVTTLPADFKTEHLVPGAHGVAVWNRHGIAIAYRHDAGKQQADKLIENLRELSKVQQSLVLMVNEGSSGASSGDPETIIKSLLLKGEKSTRSVIALQLFASSSEGAALRRFLAATAFGAVLQSLRDLHQQNLGRLHQDALSKAAASVQQNVHAIKSMQTKVEYVEIFVVGMYSIYLVHYLGDAFEFPGDYQGIWIVVGTFFAATVAAWLLRPWEHDDSQQEPGRNIRHGPETHDQSATQPLRKILAVTLMISCVLAAYLGAGFYLKGRKAPKSPKEPLSGLSSVDKKALKTDGEQPGAPATQPPVQEDSPKPTVNLKSPIDK